MEVVLDEDNAELSVGELLDAQRFYQGEIVAAV